MVPSLCSPSNAVSNATHRLEGLPLPPLQKHEMHPPCLSFSVRMKRSRGTFRSARGGRYFCAFGFGECAVDTHSVAIFNRFEPAGMRKPHQERRLIWIRKLKRSRSNGVRQMSSDMQFEFERGIKEPSDCGGGFGGVCLMILGWSLLEPSNRVAKAACFGRLAAPQPPEQES